jgi:hypothetical protein
MASHTLTVKLEEDGRQKVTIRVPQGAQREGLALLHRAWPLIEALRRTRSLDDEGAAHRG